MSPLDSPTPIEIPAVHSRMYGEPHSGPVDVTRLRVPILLMIAVIVSICSLVVSIVSVWARLDGHVDNHLIHLDPQESQRGGGLAYKFDLEAMKNAIKWDQVSEQRKTRKLIRLMAVDCRKVANGFQCRTQLPDDVE